MTNKEAIFVLKKELDGLPSDLDKSAFEKAVNLAIEALDLVTRLNGFKYCTTDVLLKEHETAHFDIYKQGWNDAIQAVINASERPLSEIVNAIKETEIAREWEAYSE